MGTKILMMTGGILAVFWGMKTAFSDNKSWNATGALVALVGLGAFLLATLLMCVPDFFS